MTGPDTAFDAAVLLLRATLGVVFVAHGYNHIFGGGRIAGTARWFDGLGMRASGRARPAVADLCHTRWRLAFYRPIWGPANLFVYFRYIELEE